MDSPTVPYGATAVRPGWAELPGPLRAAVEDRLGAAVVTAATAGGGFTSGFAAVLGTTSGGTAFVKAAPAGTPLAAWNAREAAVTAALPDGVPTARPLWTLTAADWTATGYEALTARVPPLPWPATDLAAALAAWSHAADLLRHPRPRAVAALGLPLLADLARRDLSRWSTARTAPRGLDPAALAALEARLPALAALEASLPALAADTHVLHGDLRIDNVMIDADGRAWLCDWAWPCRGPAWFDTASLLVTAHGDHDADALFARHPTAAGAPPGALDAALAALSGHWLVTAATEPPSISRDHQLFCGGKALDWLAARQGWR